MPKQHPETLTGGRAVPSEGLAEVEMVALLHQRATPAASPFMAERIAARVLAQGQARPAPLFSRAFWQDMSESLLLPRPAYMMAVCLIVGVLGGVFAGGVSVDMYNISLQQEWQGMAITEEDWI